MFQYLDIYALFDGTLTEQGYRNIQLAFAKIVKRQKWSKEVIKEGERNDFNVWNADEIDMLINEFLLWAKTEHKFAHITKTPKEYISEYFLCCIFSFKSEALKKSQSKMGLSFAHCKKVTHEICASEYVLHEISGKLYVYVTEFEKSDLKISIEDSEIIKGLIIPNYSSSGKHYKSHIRYCITEIFDMAKAPLPMDKLIYLVYQIFNKKETVSLSSLPDPGINDVPQAENENFISILSDEQDQVFEFKRVVQKLFQNFKRRELEIIHNYLLEKLENRPPSEPLMSYGSTPKSSYYHVVTRFKKFLVTNYHPKTMQESTSFLDYFFNELENQLK